MKSALDKWKPTVPFEELVCRVNDIYHSFEASTYDVRHPEIADLRPLWDEILREVQAGSPSRVWRVLDFGCGTGFASDRFLSMVDRRAIHGLTCYDPSPEMLTRCRAKIVPQYPNAQFASDRASLTVPAEGFNLLLTNSLLHHLPDPVECFREITALMSPDAKWLAGHEPSRRFYLNPACMSLADRAQRLERIQRLSSPRELVRRIRLALGFASDPARSTAAAVVQHGLFDRRPPPRVIREIVDVHVPRGPEDAASGSGLDWDELQTAFDGHWRMRWRRSYAHIGAHAGRFISRSLERDAARVAAKYPDDGANFACIWQRATS